MLSRTQPWFTQAWSLALALAACLANSTAIGAAGAGVSGKGNAASAPVAARVVSEAELRTELRNHKGRKVVLHFWATWCGPCLGELPLLARLAQEWRRKGVEFVPVSLDDPGKRSAERVGALLSRRVGDPGWSAILTTPDPAAFVRALDPEWGGEIPAFFAYDRDARLRAAHLGNITKGEFEALVSGLGP